YWGVATAIRPFITRKGYWKLKWWDSMGLERWSGRGKLAICNSDETRYEVERLFGCRCFTVGLPIDTSAFLPMDRAACRRELDLPQGRPVGLFAGSLQPHKGFPVVHALMKIIPQVHWLLLFRGSTPSKLKSGTGVTVLQDIPDAQLPVLYNAT